MIAKAALVILLLISSMLSIAEADLKPIELECEFTVDSLLGTPVGRSAHISVPSHKDLILSANESSGAPVKIIKTGIALGKIQIHRGAEVDEYEFALTGRGNPIVGFYIDRAYPVVIRIHSREGRKVMYV